MKFIDRTDAGSKLISLIADLDNPVILALPRGGLPVARAVADHFNYDLDVLIVRKLALPDSSEFALGAIAEEDVIYLSDNFGMKKVIEKETAEINRQKELFKPKKAVDLNDRNVLIVDDGLATGKTALVAGQAAKKKGASKVFGAFPVGTPQAKFMLEGDAYDEVFLYLEDPFLTSVGRFYQDFHQLTDDEALSFLD